MLVEKLSAVAPDVQTKTKILSAIAKEHNVEWDGESIEENSTPASDFLSGPSTFIKVTEQPAVQSNQLDRRTSLGTEGLVSPRVSGVNTAFQHETRPQASGGGERAQIFRGDSNTIPYDSPRWNMEFKDATSAALAAAESAEMASMAARAAAESAEMASMAARAAAELSRRESLTRQSNDHSPRNGAPDTYMRSKMVGENRSFSEHSRLQNEKIDSNTGGRYEDDRDVRKEYSHSSSLQSKASADDDSTDRYYRKNSLNEVSRSEESMQRQSENVREETIEKQESFISSRSRFSSRGSAVVFDKSDSDTENDGFHVSPTYDDEPQQVLLSTNTDSWSPSPKSSTSKIVKPPALVSLTSKSSSSDMYGSRLDDSVSVAFNESDGRASKSEEDTRVSRDFFSGRKQSVGLQSKDKSGPSFGSPYRGSPRFDQRQLSHSSDYESEESDSERYQRKKFDADLPAWKPAADQPALVPKKNRTELNSIGNSSPEREEGLNFGKLTGGLRHKGYNYPSFGKNQLDVSRSKKESKEATDIFAKSTVVPADKNTKPDLRPTLDNDSSEEEEEEEEEKPLQKRSDHRHKLYTLSGGKDLKTKPSFVASNPIFGSENSDLDEDLPKEFPSKPRRLHSGISRRTKAFPSDHEKEKLSKLQHRSETLDVDDGMDRKATSSVTPKRYETERESSKLGSEPAKPENSTSVRIQKSKVSEAHEQKPTKSYSAESQQQFQSLKGNSSDQPSSSKVTPNSRGYLYQSSSEKANSPRMQESKVGPKLSSAKEASLPRTKSEPSIRQENPKAETLSKTNSNKDFSNQKASHVHPKLPEYDSFVQFFQKNRS